MRTRNLLAYIALLCAVLLPATFSAADAAPAAADGSTVLQVVDRAAEVGIDTADYPTWEICVGDWDGNLEDDFLVTRHMENAGALLTQSAGVFSQQLKGDPQKAGSPLIAGIITPKVTRSTSTAQFPKHTGVDRHDCAMGDLDKNGLTDVLTTAGRYASNRVKHSEIDNEAFMQVAPGVIEDRAMSTLMGGLNEPCHRSRQITIADFTGDGWLDVFVGAQLERDQADACNAVDAQGVRIKNGYNEQAHFYVNLGDPESDGAWNGLRQDPSYNVSAANTGVGMALEWDQNNDGKLDLLSLAFPNNRPLLLRNTGSGFTTVTFSNITRLPNMNNAKIGDVTADGLNDLVYADNNGFYHRTGTTNGVSTVSKLIGTVPAGADGWRLAIGDAEGDGDMDVYGMVSASSGTGNPDDVLYINDGAGNFTAMAVPTTGGAANNVATLMVGGVAQFLVANGGTGEEGSARGKMQLIAAVELSGS